MSALLAPTAVLARASPRLAARPARLAPAPAAASPARRVARPAARLLTVAAAGKSEPAASSFDTAEVLATLTEKVGSGAGPQAHVAASGREAQQQPAAVEARRDDC
jgi:hypothetical protein